MLEQDSEGFARVVDILIEGLDSLVLRTELFRNVLDNRVGAINVVLVRLPCRKGHSLARVIEPAQIALPVSGVERVTRSRMVRTCSGSRVRRASQ